MAHLDGRAGRPREDPTAAWSGGGLCTSMVVAVLEPVAGAISCVAAASTHSRMRALHG